MIDALKAMKFHKDEVAERVVRKSFAGFFIANDTGDLQVEVTEDGIPSEMLDERNDFLARFQGLGVLDVVID